MRSFEALADSTRRKILSMLVKRELAATAIARKFTLTPPAISQHLAVLKAAKLVRMRADAQKRLYRIDPRGLEKAEKWLHALRVPKKTKSARRTKAKKRR